MTTPTTSTQQIRQDIAAYLRAQGAPLHVAAEAQKKWAPLIAAVFEDMKAGKPAVAALRARGLGHQFTPIFKRTLEHAEGLKPPQTALRCQEYFVRWIRSLVNAADALAGAPEDGRDAAYLRDAHDYLEDARYAVKPLTDLRLRLYDIAQGKKPPAAPAAKTEA
jgi:hypothetical protein